MLPSLRAYVLFAKSVPARMSLEHRKLNWLACGRAFAPAQPPKEARVFWTAGRLWRWGRCGRVVGGCGWFRGRLAVRNCAGADARGWLRLWLRACGWRGHAAIDLVL